MLNDSLSLAFEMANFTMDANLEGVSHQESLQPPQPSGNCVNWTAGHILSTRDMILAIMGETPFLTAEETNLYKRGSQPLRPEDPCVDLDRIRQGLGVTAQTIGEKLKTLTAQEFDSPLDPSVFPVPVEKPTLGSMLTLIMFHEGYHVGQIGMGRRLIGKPGAIA